MTAVEYQRAMRKLGCTDKEVCQSLRLIGSLTRKYPWVNVDELLTLGLESVPRAFTTHGERGASRATHLMTVTRNACLSFLKREEKQRGRASSLGDTAVSPLGVESPEEVTSYEDMLQVLAEVLSPYAWQLLRLTKDSLPDRVTMKETGKALGLSPVSVSHLYAEIRSVMREVLPESFLESGEGEL